MSTSANSPRADKTRITQVISAKAGATGAPEVDETSQQEEEDLVSRAWTIGALPAKAQLHYAHLAQIQRVEDQLKIVRSERDEQRADNRRLRSIELGYVKLRSARWVSALANASAIAGGALISQGG